MSCRGLSRALFSEQLAHGFRDGCEGLWKQCEQGLALASAAAAAAACCSLTLFFSSAPAQRAELWELTRGGPLQLSAEGMCGAVRCALCRPAGGRSCTQGQHARAQAGTQGSSETPAWAVAEQKGAPPLGWSSALPSAPVCALPFLPALPAHLLFLCPSPSPPPLPFLLTSSSSCCCCAVFQLSG